LLVKVGHVEAGLRSFDRTMPEEINRLLTDQVSDLLFTPSKDGNENLAREGIAPEKVHFVGNVMIDTLIRMLPVARQQIPQDLPERYVLVTLHRPSNVDDLGWLAEMVTALREIASDVPVVFPVHPRTRKKLADAGLQADGLRIIDPLPYVEFVGSQTRAALVITDSGGIQEETTYLGVPCITVRENTERPITVEMGTNHLVGRSIERICSAAYEILNGSKKDAAIPPLWDGHAAERIAAVIAAGRF
jgi:UDP-N-acetylglucosamine 2-epimerase (non-hydrolysing)